MLVMRLVCCTTAMAQTETLTCTLAGDAIYGCTIKNTDLDRGKSLLRLEYKIEGNVPI
jgi:hypothetical protein